MEINSRQKDRRQRTAKIDKLKNGYLLCQPNIYRDISTQRKQRNTKTVALKKYRLYICFEAEMGAGGIEGMSRFYRPRDMIFLCKAIKSEWVGVCIDFEHILSQNMNPKKEIETIPFGDCEMG